MVTRVQVINIPRNSPKNAGTIHDFKFFKYGLTSSAFDIDLDQVLNKFRYWRRNYFINLFPFRCIIFITESCLFAFRVLYILVSPRNLFSLYQYIYKFALYIFLYNFLLFRLNLVVNNVPYYNVRKVFF